MQGPHGRELLRERHPAEPLVDFLGEAILPLLRGRLAHHASLDENLRQSLASERLHEFDGHPVVAEGGRANPDWFLQQKLPLFPFSAADQQRHIFAITNRIDFDDRRGLARGRRVADDGVAHRHVQPLPRGQQHGLSRQLAEEAAAVPVVSLRVELGHLPRLGQHHDRFAARLVPEHPQLAALRGISRVRHAPSLGRRPAGRRPGGCCPRRVSLRRPRTIG